jgi:hypothetical protein
MGLFTLRWSEIDIGKIHTWLRSISEDHLFKRAAWLWSIPSFQQQFTLGIKLVETEWTSYGIVNHFTMGRLHFTAESFYSYILIHTLHGHLFCVSKFFLTILQLGLRYPYYSIVRKHRKKINGVEYFQNQNSHLRYVYISMIKKQEDSNTMYYLITSHTYTRRFTKKAI